MSIDVQYSICRHMMILETNGREKWCNRFCLWHVYHHHINWNVEIWTWLKIGTFFIFIISEHYIERYILYIYFTIRLGNYF